MAQSKPPMAPTSSLVDAMNSVNLFGGRFQADDLEFRDSERREAEKKFQAARKERERELKMQNERRMREEFEYASYVKGQTSPKRNQHTQDMPQECDRGYMQEEARLNSYKMGNNLKKNPNQKSIRGRGNIMNELSESLPRGRGRGRWLPQEQERLAFNERQERVKSNVQQYADAHLHSNSVQKSVWTAGRGIGLNNNEEKTDFYPNDIHSLPSSSSTSASTDQYEDAECSSPWSSTSYDSFPNWSANNSPVTVASPVPERFASPVASDLPRRQVIQEVASVPPRRNRFKKLAAKFSNAEDFSMDLNDFPALPNS